MYSKSNRDRTSFEDIKREILKTRTMEEQTDKLGGGGTSRVLPRMGLRVILFPLPLQGHLNPMLQLASILYSQGFSITIIHTTFNSPKHSNYPDFTFKSIEDGLPVRNDFSDMSSIGFLLKSLNESCEEPFHKCLAELLAAGSGAGSDNRPEEPIACLITDAIWHFTQAVADDHKLPRIVLRTSSLSSFLVYAALPLFVERGYFDQDSQESDSPLPEFPVLKFKDIPKITSNPEALGSFMPKIVQATKAASAVIWNTFKELEEPALSTICQDFPIPHFPIGPFHKYFPASSSSLLEQDRSFMHWLDLQAPKSVIYISCGSVAQIKETEFKEIARGLAKSKRPFLWVVRPGSVNGSEWIETLPDELLKEVTGRGHIIKWAPQHEVLAHPATGSFWTHKGWNSTLESICEGVPMICLPCFVDQPINSRYVSDVWKIGVRLENGLESGEIEKALNRVMVDEEGKDIRVRINNLKEKANLCLEEGGSSYQSLRSLVHHILSL